MNTQNLGKTITILFAASLLVAITGCKVEVSTDEEPAAAAPAAAPPTAPAATPPAALLGTAWWVEDIGGKGVIDMSHTTLDFTQEGQVGGDTGCNRYFGSVEIGDGDVTFGALGGTRMACAEALMNQEQAFYEAIGKAVSWEIADTGLLHLRDADGNDQIRAAATDDP